MTKKSSRIISKVLSPAIKLWLRSQVEKIENLQFNIEGSDRQIIGGTIPAVFLAANKAIYQGIHLGEVKLTATGININIGQVLKGKPLRLLEPIKVTGEIVLEETDFNASLQAPLLGNAVSDFLIPLLKIDTIENLTLQNPQVAIEVDRLILTATLVSDNNENYPLILRTGLQLASNHELKFDKPELETAEKIKSNLVDGLQVDLGTEVDIEELTLNNGRLMCQGSINVLPDV